MTLKILPFEFGVEIEKPAPPEFLFVLSYLSQKFELIFKFNLGGQRFFDELKTLELDLQIPQVMLKSWFISKKN